VRTIRPFAPSEARSAPPASPLPPPTPARRPVPAALPLLVALLALPALLALLALPACKVDANKFQSRIFACNTAAPDPLCGTDQNGENMTCFAARQIGGADFCTQKCDAPMSLPDQGAVCVQGNAKLQACMPSNDDIYADGACGRRDLGCLRTDVLNDEGICITMNPCLTDTDCRDPVRSTCASTFLTQLYAGKPPIKADHLYCLQKDCIHDHTSCSPGEVCLPSVIPAAANPPDICVPKCDSHGRCPPNHFCLSTISGPANEPVCIPGLLGFVCQSDVDCLVGSCVSDGDPDAEHGLKLCTTSCGSDADCAKFDSLQGRFVCSEGPKRHCITPDAYTGALCNSTADCVRDKGTVCVHTSETTQNCLRPCAADGSCARRGGVGHTCVPLPGDDGSDALVCAPGFFPYPCFDDSQCAVPGLACAGVDLTDPMHPQNGSCTRLCASDADCEKDKWTTGQSYCGAPSKPVCLPLGADGAACPAAKQCASQVCAKPPGGMTTTCGGKVKP
jgi:hypothetical protein